MSGPRPLFTAHEAVARALLAAGTGTYQLGTGDVDTPIGGQSDCCGFATCWCYGIRRHRPGFNRGANNRRGDVEDDVNCNSSLDDAERDRDLFEVIDRPELGCLLKYPTIHLPGHEPWCGHEAIVVGVSRCLEWDTAAPDYSLLDVVQMCGPNGHHPGIIKSDGAIWRNHDHNWPKPEHRTWMLRVRP